MPAGFGRSGKEHDAQSADRGGLSGGAAHGARDGSVRTADQRRGAGTAPHGSGEEARSQAVLGPPRLLMALGCTPKVESEPGTTPGPGQLSLARSETCPTHGWFAPGAGRCTCTQLNPGDRLKVEGAAAALAAEEAKWRDAADYWIRSLAAAGKQFNAEDVRLLAGDPPGHVNAMGGLFLSAARRGLIRSVGYENATRKSGHARPIRVWVGT